MPELIPVYLYARFSSDNQRSESIDAQVRAMDAYCANRGYVVVGKYVDEAISGTSDDRPAFQRMMKDAVKREAKFIVVHKLDRFMRNKYESVMDKHELKLHGVRVVSVVENLDDSPESVMLESLLEGMAEYFSMNLSREVKKGLRENAYQGRLTGGFPPLGYDVDAEGHYIVNEGEAESVRLIFKWTLDGRSYGEIIDDLNLRGKRTKAGNQFTKGSLYDLLRNEKYKGVLVHSKYAKGMDGKRKRHNPNTEGTLYLPDLVPEIVDPETWRKVNEMMDGRKSVGRPATQYHYILSGILICGECGFTYEGGYARAPFYRCSGQKYKKSTCSSSRANAQEIEQFVIDVLRTRLLNKRAIRSLIPKLRNSATSKAIEAATDALAMNERLVEINDQAARLVDAIMEMGGSDAIKARLKALEDEKQKIVRALVDAELDTRVYSSTEEEIADLLQADVKAAKSNDQDEVERLIKKYVDRVIISYDPDDPPRSGHKRKYSLIVETVLPKSSPIHGTPKDVHTIRLFFQMTG